MVSPKFTVKHYEIPSKYNGPKETGAKKSSGSFPSKHGKEQKRSKQTQLPFTQTSDIAVSSAPQPSPKKSKGAGNSAPFSSAVMSSAIPHHHRHQRVERLAKVQAAVAEALSTEDSHNRRNWGVKGGRDSEKERADEYGKGAPTDRLQFGYSPSIAEEAVCFHQHISPTQWIEDRQRIGKLVYSKHQKNPYPNCELIIPALKLREHWKQQSLLQAQHHNGPALNLRKADDDTFDNLLKLFASKQRMNT